MFTNSFRDFYVAILIGQYLGTSRVEFTSHGVFGHCLPSPLLVLYIFSSSGVTQCITLFLKDSGLILAETHDQICLGNAELNRLK